LARRGGREPRPDPLLRSPVSVAAGGKGSQPIASANCATVAPASRRGKSTTAASLIPQRVEGDRNRSYSSLAPGVPAAGMPNTNR
jgi:hypothetical protein